MVAEIATPAFVPPMVEEAWVPNYAGPSKMLAKFNSDIKNVVQMKSDKIADNFHKAKKQAQKPAAAKTATP